METTTLICIGFSLNFLGGWVQWAAAACPAAAAVCGEWPAFQVPTGRQLIITGVDITCFNQGAAVATTPTVFEWVLATNSSAVSMATEVEAAGVYEYEKTPIGVMTGAVGLALGGAFNEVHLDLGNRPKVVNSGRFVSIVNRGSLGTATASEIYQCRVSVSGYYRN
jgi:hypothetical protein